MARHFVKWLLNITICYELEIFIRTAGNGGSFSTVTTQAQHLPDTASNSTERMRKDMNRFYQCLSCTHPQHLQIVEDLQSSLTRTTNVVFFVDDKKVFKSNQFDNIFLLFSNKRTYYVITPNNQRTTVWNKSPSLNQFKQNELNTITKVVNKAKLSPNLRQESYEPELSGSIWNNQKKITSTESKPPPPFGNNGQNSNPEILPLSSDSSLLFFAHNHSAIASFEEVLIHNPSLIKTIFLYGDCNYHSQILITEEMRKFSARLWTEFHVMFIYFLTYCSALEYGPGDTIENESQSNKRAYSSKNGKPPPPTRGLTESTSFLSNEINNGIASTASKACVMSLHVYDPFEKVSTVGGGSDDGGHNDLNYGKLRKIKLSEGYETIYKDLMKKVFSLNGYHLKIAFFANSMAVQRVNVQVMARNLPPHVLANSFYSIDSYFGLDPEVVIELSRRMNFTPDIAPPSDKQMYGFLQPNGTLNGALGEVAYGKVECALNGYFIKDYGTRLLDFSTPLQDDKLCITVQTAGLIPHSLLMFKMFSRKLWLLLFSTFIFVSVLYSYLLYMIEKLNEPMKPNQNSEPFKSSNELYNKLSAVLSQCARIIAVLLNAPVSHVFNSSSRERFFVSLCLLWGLNIIGSFQGSLIDMYTTPMSYPNIDTLEALDRSGTKIYVRHWNLAEDIFGTEKPGTLLGDLRRKLRYSTNENLYFDITYNSSMGGLIRLLETIQIISYTPYRNDGTPLLHIVKSCPRKKLTPTTDDKLYARIAHDNSVAGFIRMVQVPELLVQMPYRDDGAIPLHTVYQCPRTYILSYIFPKSSALLGPVNHYISLFASSGLISKWIKDTIYIFKFQSKLQNRDFAKTQQIILTLKHLQIAFIILSIGLLLSTIVFFTEVYIDKKRPNRKFQLNIK